MQKNKMLHFRNHRAMQAYDLQYGKRLGKDRIYRRLRRGDHL